MKREGEAQPHEVVAVAAATVAVDAPAAVFPLAITVHGVPVPQGSKQPWGGEVNPHVKAWRTSIAQAAAELLPDGPLHDPVVIDAQFYFPRPLAHYRSGKHRAELRADAPYWVARAPDLDKLLRAVGDALSGVVVTDDRQIVAWNAAKRYEAPARVELIVRPVPR